jgi:hypothetical protein
MKKEGAFILKIKLIIESLSSSRIQISLFFYRENRKDSPTVEKCISGNREDCPDSRKNHGNSFLETAANNGAYS